uniref:Uncharacterized protein n=1 Tax=Vespula pensylvanica TaxID=30213 RepID=A0A834P2R6_VESPE|nr:hypothetical protein H0235_008199 [Vespula pensylvanica]
MSIEYHNSYWKSINSVTEKARVEEARNKRIDVKGRIEARWSKNKKTETSTRSFPGSTMNTCPPYCLSETHRYVRTFHLSLRDEKTGLKNTRFPIMKRPS